MRDKQIRSLKLVLETYANTSYLKQALIQTILLHQPFLVMKCKELAIAISSSIWQSAWYEITRWQVEDSVNVVTVIGQEDITMFNY